MQIIDSQGICCTQSRYNVVKTRETKRIYCIDNQLFAIFLYLVILPFFAYFLLDTYSKKDLRMVKIALNRFKDFLKEQYPLYEYSIKPDLITKDMMERFVKNLQSRSVGEGAKSIYQRFKKVVRYAIDHEVMQKDPYKGVVCKVDDQVLHKDVLSMDEIQALLQCHYENENPNVRRAFILCLYCGLRFCDVKDLTYKNVDYTNRLLKFEQNKPKGHSAHSGVIIPLNDGLLSLIGEAPEDLNLLASGKTFLSNSL